MHFSQERTCYIITSFLSSFNLGPKTHPFVTLVMQPSCLLSADNYAFLWGYSSWKHIVCPLFLFPYVVTQRNKQKFPAKKSENICIFLNTFNRPPRKDCACVSTIYKSCTLMHLHLKRCKLNPFSETNCWHFWLLFTESTFQCSSNPVYFWVF